MNTFSDSRLPRRQSLRLRGYDYSTRGLYFVTVCSHRKKCLLGTVECERVRLSPAGRAVQRAWYGLPKRFPGLMLDAFVVMPNHVHGVIAIVGAGLAPPAGAASCAPTGARFSLGDVMRVFKSTSAIAANRVLRREGTPLWQRNFYEHIIRRGEDLTKIQRYVLENPMRWALDLENPACKSPQICPWDPH